MARFGTVCRAAGSRIPSQIRPIAVQACTEESPERLDFDDIQIQYGRVYSQDVKTISRYAGSIMGRPSTIDDREANMDLWGISYPIRRSYRRQCSCPRLTMGWDICS